LRKMMIGWLLQRSYSVADERDELARLIASPEAQDKAW
jgi:hypothetical protein